MVDPIDESERASFTRRVKYAVTGLVGVSAGLVTLQADATLVETVGAVLLGLTVGYPLARYIIPSGPAPATRQRQRRERLENPFADGGDDGGDGDNGGDGGVKSESGSGGGGDGGAKNEDGGAGRKDAARRTRGEAK